MQAYQPKKLLLVLEINQLLFYINNANSKYVKTRYSENYHQEFKNYKISYRRGRVQFLDYLFVSEKDNFDIALWTNLNSSLTEGICHKYFSRFYRQLLFVMTTNRSLYTNSNDQQSSLPIRKDLSTIYNRFGYNSTNTLVLSNLPNIMEDHKKNDLIIPSYNLERSDISGDPGLFAVMKYLKGIYHLHEQNNCNDIKKFTQAKNMETMFNRVAHNIFSQHTYK